MVEVFFTGAGRFFWALETGERFRLQKQDVGLPNSLSLGSLFASVRVRQPKNARQMGRHQFAIIRNVAFLVH